MRWSNASPIEEGWPSHTSSSSGGWTSAGCSASATNLDCTPDRVGVVGVVGVDRPAVRHRLQEFFCGSAVRRLAGGEKERDWPVEAVRQCVDLGRAPAARATDGLLPPPAGASFQRQPECWGRTTCGEAVQEVAAGGTASTSQSALRSTASATLPRKNLSRPLPPCVPTTTRSADPSFAAARISSAGEFRT